MVSSVVSFWRATHSLSPLWGHGCTVGIDRDPPVWPSTQAGWWRYQSASSYVRAYGLRVRCARGRVRGCWFCGVGAVDTRTPPRTMSLALSFDLGCQVSNLCSQQQPNALLLAMLLSSPSRTSAGSVDSASFSSAGSSVFSLVHTLVLGDLNCLRFFSLVRALVLDDLNWWFSCWLCRRLFRGQLLLVLNEKLVDTVGNMLVDLTV